MGIKIFNNLPPYSVRTMTRPHFADLLQTDQVDRYFE